MDRYMGCVSNELATITGLELTVAPRRPAHMTHKCAACPSAHTCSHAPASMSCSKAAAQHESCKSIGFKPRKGALHISSID